MTNISATLESVPKPPSLSLAAPTQRSALVLSPTFTGLPLFCFPPGLAKVASAAGSADAVDDENDRDGVEHPARMTTAPRPKIAEGAKQVGTANQQARRQPRLSLER